MSFESFSFVFYNLNYSRSKDVYPIFRITYKTRNRLLLTFYLKFTTVKILTVSLYDGSLLVCFVHVLDIH